MRIKSRREFIKSVGLTAAAASLPALSNFNCGILSKSSNPNILLIFTDDQRYNTINALGNDDIITPNMDRLVRSGITFTHAHIMGGTSGAVCIPSRAMLMTGRSIFHLQNKGSTIPAEHEMLPEFLKRAGYSTYGIGKWHNDRRSYARAFKSGGKVFFGGMSDHLKVPLFDHDESGEYPDEKKYTGKGFSSEIFTDEAIKHLDRNPDNPFFMYIAYTAPHDPRMAPEKYTKLYPPDKIKLPENYLDEHPFDNGEMNVRDENLAQKPRTPEIVREHLSGYYAMITHLDDQIGRLLDHLEMSGMVEKTIIIFAGDNGLAVGSHGLLGKQNLYEHSVRVPLVISGPGIPENVRSGGLCYITDIFPTVCDLLESRIPATVEGKSLINLIKNREEKIRDSVFYAYTKLQRGVRTNDNWKLIKYNAGGIQTTQLFNLNGDPNEINNLANNIEYSARMNDLTFLLKRQMKELDDFCDLDKPNWGLPEEITEKKTVNHLAVGGKIQLKNQYSQRYTGGGEAGLIDGVRGTSNFNDGSWQGFEGTDLEAVIDLGKFCSVNKVTVGIMEAHDSWIFLPSTVEFSLSENGIDYFSVKIYRNNSPVYNQFRKIHDITETFSGDSVRFIKVAARNIGTCPDWHQGAGKKAWVFADEIIVE
ncbi:sulfatase-like hydrolase/transferase [candidate division KSB1 bacterium]